MKSFKQYIIESERLFRFDDKKIIPKPQTYAFSPDNTGSGNVERWKDAPPDWERKTGVFAGKYSDVLPFSVPRETKWIIPHDRDESGKQTIYFAKSDRRRIKQHRSQLTQYNERQGFEKLRSGSEFHQVGPGEALAGEASGRIGPEEYFSRSGADLRPIKKKIIQNPLRHLQRHYNVQFVDDLDAVKKHFTDNGIGHNAEGYF